MRWLPVAKKDGSKDPYAIALATHTVSRTLDGEREVFQAWRMTPRVPAVLLGTYLTSLEAKSRCELDAKQPESGEEAA